MVRMHTPGKGIAQSARPYKRSVPSVSRPPSIRPQNLGDPSPPLLGVFLGLSGDFWDNLSRRQRLLN